MAPTGPFIGIDVAKQQVEVAVRPTGERWRVATDAASLAGLVARLRALGVALIVLEPTGGYEMPVVAALSAAQLPVVVVNARQVRKFAGALGKLAKTDAIDAAVLAHFAEAVKPEVRPLADELTQTLQGWLGRRRQLLEMLQAEEQRLAMAPRAVRPQIQHHIEWLRNQTVVVLVLNERSGHGQVDTVAKLSIHGTLSASFGYTLVKALTNASLARFGLRARLRLPSLPTTSFSPTSFTPWPSSFIARESSLTRTH